MSVLFIPKFPAPNTVPGPEQALKYLLNKKHMSWHCLMFAEQINLAKDDCQS